MSDESIELPEGWSRVALNEITYRITKGTTPTSLGFQFTESGILFVKVESLSGQRINHKLCAFINSDADQALARSQLQENDILFSIAGTLGRVAIVQKEDLPANTNQAISIIRLILPTLSDYVALVLSSQLLEDSIRSGGRGVGLQNLNLQQVSEFKIPFPPIAEQKRIVAKIEELRSKTQKAREALEAIPEMCDRFRQSVLAAAFRGDLTAEWREENPDVAPAAVLLESIRKERRQNPKYKEPEAVDELFNIAESWTWANLPEIGELNRGKSKHRPRNDPALFGGAYPFIQTGDVSAANGLITKFSQTYSEFGLQQSRLWKKGTLCITIAANIAETAILGFDACFPDSIVGFLPNESLCSVKFVEYFIRTVKRDLEQFAPATAQKNINLEVLRLVSVPLPPIMEQEEIVHLIDVAFEAIDRIQQQYEAAKARLEKLDRAILAKAFRGELVPQDPNDEPASVLLDRIRQEREKVSDHKSTKRKK